MELSSDWFFVLSLNPWQPESSSRLFSTEEDIDKGIMRLQKVRCLLDEGPMLGLAGKLRQDFALEERT